MPEHVKEAALKELNRYEKVPVHLLKVLLFAIIWNGWFPYLGPIEQKMI